MFKKAVDAHENASVNTQAPGKQVSSSPNWSSDASIQPPLQFDNGQQPKVMTKVLQPLRPSAINRNPTRKPLATNCGIKRTANGLAKAISGSSQDSFRDTPVAQSAKGSQNLPSQENACFDEDDFDSDLDLEVETRSSKSAIKYPSIPPSRADKTSSVTYPAIQRAELHTQSQRKTSLDASHAALDEPSPSSLPVPWSSSPVSHLAPPTSRPIFQQYAYKDEGNQITKPASSHAEVLEENPDAQRRPAKRRALPFWANASESSTEVSQQSTSSNTIVGSRVSSTPQTKPAGQYLWNTTASAIKEQQKQLRKANKKSTKTSDVADDLAPPAVRAKKAATVSRPGLSREQRHVLDLVVEHGKSVFFTGSAGTGKSVLLREIIAVLRKKYLKEQDRVAMTASTGLAACNIGGVTLHSFAGIGLGKEEVPELVKKIKRNHKAKQRWMRTKILVVDEISMVDGELFDKLEQIGRQVRNNSRPFGGIQLVITGDFFQLPPVPDSGRAARFCFDAATWNTVIDHTIGLNHVFRQKDSAFADMLNEMREGRLSQSSVAAFKKLSRPLDSHDDIAATELFPTRNEVDAANSARMRMLHGGVVRFDARDGGTIVDKAQRDRLLANCMAPELLELKKGAQVMLIKNIDDMLVNGSLGRVYGFMSESQFDSYSADPAEFETLRTAEDEDLNAQQVKKKRAIQLAASTSQAWPLVRFSMPDGTTRDLLCNREQWKIELPNGEVQASRSQVPLILAWALSIHKAQGQTLERVKVDLGKVFERGQAYVALSRATTMGGLQVLRFEERKVMAHEKVRTFYEGLAGVGDVGKSRDEEFD